MRKPFGLVALWFSLGLTALACGVSDPVEPAAPPAGQNDGGAGSTGSGAASNGAMPGDGGIASGGDGGLGGSAGAGGNPNPGGAGGAGTGGASGADPGGAAGALDAGMGSGGTGPGVDGAAGGFDAGSDPNRNRVQPGTVCARLATIQCAGEAACCANPGRSFEQCEAYMRNGCVTELFLDDITLNSVSGYSVDAAETAFNRFEELASMCDVTVASWGASAEGLGGITQGTRAPGANCAPPNPLNTADAAGYLVACTGESACLPTLLSGWSCAPRAAAGGNCFTDLNCQDGLYCDNPELTVASGNVCRARKSDGSSCELLNECQSLACRGGICVPQDQQVAYCLPQ